MRKFCFIVHPLSIDDVARNEPGAARKGAAIIAKIMEWMPPWAVAHVTGARTADGRETEGWLISMSLLPQQMLSLPREEVYDRIFRAIGIGAELVGEIAGLGKFTGVVGDGGVTLVTDATAAFDADGMRAAHQINGPRYAHAIVNTKELLAPVPASEQHAL